MRWPKEREDYVKRFDDSRERYNVLLGYKQRASFELTQVKNDLMALQQQE